MAKLTRTLYDREVPKLKRINSIIQLFPDDSHQGFDLCCDHGEIGLGLYQKRAEVDIRFYDQVKSIINDLKYKTSDIPEVRNNIFLADCKTAKIVGVEKSCFIISGIGGALAVKILENILNFNPDKEIYFLTCIHQNSLKFKEEIRPYGLKLVRREYVEENNKLYELMLFNTVNGQLWDLYSNSACERPDYQELFLREELDYLATKLRYSNHSEYSTLYSSLKALLDG